MKLKAHAVIVGKIILDKYGPPKEDDGGDDNCGVTIGGGGQLVKLLPKMQSILPPNCSAF